MGRLGWTPGQCLSLSLYLVSSFWYRLIIGVNAGVSNLECPKLAIFLNF